MPLLDRFRMTDKVAVVTGAGRGIGRGVAVALAEMGADVVCAARTEKEIAATAEAVRAFGRRALPISCDVTDTAQLEALPRRTVETFGRLDVLVNNAGGYPPMSIADTDLAPACRTSRRGTAAPSSTSRRRPGASCRRTSSPTALPRRRSRS
jgi:7-alpha-hydroxysteroid dehydrogenase